MKLLLFLVWTLVPIITHAQAEKSSIAELDVGTKTSSHPISIYFLSLVDDLTNISASCQRDEELMIHEFDKINSSSEFRFKHVEIPFSKDSVIFALNEVRPKSNDVIVFYYSGHGFRYRDQMVSKFYPYMAFNTAPKNGVMPKMFNIQDIHKSLLEKSARLTITIGDLCNSNTSLSVPSTASISGVNECLSQLFGRATGDIIITSSILGQPSITTEVGSIFTIAFTQALGEETDCFNGENASWNELIEETIRKTIIYSQGQQVPFAELDIDYLPSR